MNKTKYESTADQPTSKANLPERDGVARENLSKLLDRAINLYGICLRDYFSAFSTYTTATSILVAAIGFLAKEKQPPQLIFVVASCGMLVCWQWYISTASLRDQYAFFKKRITDLEKKLDGLLREGDGLLREGDGLLREGDGLLMSRWLRCVDEARRGTSLDKLRDPQREDVANLNFRFRSLNRPWGMRGTMLPVIYSCVFFAVMIWVLANAIVFSPALNPDAKWITRESIGGWLAVLAALVWLFWLVGSIRRRAKKLRYARTSGVTTELIE